MFMNFKGAGCESLCYTFIKNYEGYFMKSKCIAILLMALSLSLIGCGEEAATINESEDLVTDSGTVQIEIEEVAPEENKVEESTVAKTRKPIRVAVVGSPATDILELADKALENTDYCIEIVKCDDFKSPNELVMNGDVIACLSENQVLLDSYNKIDDSDLIIAERIYVDPLAIFPGKIQKLNELTNNETIAIESGDVNVARALYLLEQKGIVSIKEGALYQATMEDVTSNPYNIKIEQVDLSAGWPDVNKYGLIISDYNRAVISGVDPATSIGEENRNSNIFDLFAVGLVVKSDDVDNPMLKTLSKAINSEEVEDAIKESFYKSVLDYK